MIWIFGDSFSAPYQMHLDRKNQWAIDYCEYKKRIPKTFDNVLFDLLDIPTKNLALPGSDNYTIFHTYIKVIEQINEDDTLIFGWSSPLRYRLGNIEGGFSTILAENGYKLVNHLFDKLTQNTIDEMLLIRNSTAYYRELEDFMKIIEHASPTKNIYHWSPFKENRLNLKNIHQIAPNGIRTETNEIIKDEHYGETGHLSLAMYFYKKIKSKNNANL
jgi:hypothetical protein